ncbi:hypothetical protein BDV29DRAFT_197310 [Aspergillus leporis]|uniref:Transferase family-domain-containing protein n=1 Tax=Aspergillus leporis TaxID=41062 RepID=A0A5N5WSK7_9EURO|nr:hypothetical protein BDV29DRAFT_197310 [Aspergillus leporis]
MVDSEEQPKVDLISSTQVFPIGKHEETTVLLSVVDAIVIHYGPSSVVCFFDSSLDKSLQVTFSTFPHFAGYLSMVTSNPNGDHTQRYARSSKIRSTTDPGERFDIAKCAANLDDLIPGPDRRRSPEFQSWAGNGGSSAVMIQATQFACGAISIGAMMAHPFADAHTLTIFMHLATSCKRPFPDVDGSPQTEPLFDTQLLEYSAAGNIGDRKPDQAMLERSRSLPSLQHDYIAPAPGEGPDRDTHITAGEGATKYDAILAHVWRAVNWARLPPSFVGSPILSTTVTTTGKEASGDLPLSGIVARINRTLALYTKDALSARIHDLCFECAPQQFWEGFLGKRYMVWGMARYVDAKMQELDKMIWVMGGRPTATVDVEGRHWCDDVVDISSNVGVHAADRLRRDQRLWNMEG